MKKRREIKAWIVMDGDQPACWDYRLPITWLRSTAVQDCAEKEVGGVVRRVTIIVEEK